MTTRRKETRNRFQYSKVLVFMTGALFIATLIFCLKSDFSTMYDTTLYVSAITITGGVFGSAIIWYEKKAQAENVSKIKLQHVQDLAEIEYNIYKRKLILEKELGVLGNPDAEDMSAFHIDDQRLEATDRDMSYIEGKFDDSTADPEIQSFR